VSPQRIGLRRLSADACPRRIRRFVEPALLLLVNRRPSHGYALIEGLRSLGLGRYPIDSSAIYRSLRRLEGAGMVRSTWETEIAAGPPRRVYTITPAGESYLADWVEDLQATEAMLRVFLGAYRAAPAAMPEPVDRRRASGRARPADPSQSPSSKEEVPMKVVVSSQGPGLDAAISPTFGRCPTFVFADTDTMQVSSVSNPAQNAPGGAGIEAAQFVASRGAQAVLTGKVGPNASAVLSEASLAVYLVGSQTVGQALEAFRAGKLTRFSPEAPQATIQGSLGPTALSPARDAELAALAAEAAELRGRLAAIVTRITELEKEA